jgi:arylsulfatase A-like enzyme
MIRHNHHACLAAFLGFCFAAPLVFGQAEQPLNQPNVIVILTDDHGWPDISAQGVLDDVRTPHTDKLAASGVRFTSGYSSAPQCRPARPVVIGLTIALRVGMRSEPA